MALTRDQLDSIDNIFNNRRLDNKIKLENRKALVYEKIPALWDCDKEISSLSISAGRKALLGDTSAMDSLRENINVISEQKKALLLSHNYPANYLDEIFTCNDCKDTGFIDSKPCSCLKQEIVKLLYSRSELKEILQRENFDTFDYDYYSDSFIDQATGLTSSENIEDVVDHCHYFINNFDKTFDNLLFYGRAGTGKTFLINCIAKELIEKSRSVVYLSAVQFFDLLADYSFRRSNNSVYTQISINELQSCDLLIIDDLATEMNNSYISFNMKCI